MTTDFVVFISPRMRFTVLYILLSMLGSALMCVVIVVLFQAVTSIQEVTLTFIPMLAVVGLVILMLIPWMLDLSIQFSLLVFDQITQLGK